MKSIHSEKQFKDLLNQEKPFVLDFYADWCGPCQSLLPVVEKLAEEYQEEVEIVKVNVDQQGEIAQAFNVRSIPTLFFMKKDQVIDRLQGLASEKVLREKVDALI